jgi:transcriptional regulator with XRE-family HTH domain
MPQGDNPVSQLRRLRADLRQQREAHGFTQREVAEALDWSQSKLIRIERGPVGISVTDVRALLQHYGVTNKEQVDNLVELARGSKKPGWWDRYRDFMSTQLLTFLALESSSVRIRKYQGLTVPAILQHPDYARAIISAIVHDPVSADRDLEIRVARRQLVGPDGPELLFIVDESVLHRQVGSPEIMHTQLLWLMEMHQQPNVTIQVVPFSVGVHRGMRGSFTIFELSDEQDDYALQLEEPYVDRLIQETSDETREYVSIFRELEKIALPPEESIALVARIAATGGES